MPDLYLTIGVLCSCAVILVGRANIIRLRKDGDMETTIPVSVMTVFASLFIIFAWPVVAAIIALMWALGFCTFAEIKDFIRKHLRKSE